MGRTIQNLAIFGLIVAVIGLVGCRTFNVRTDWDSDASFDNYRRYFWVEPPAVEGANPFADNTLLRKRIRSAIETELDRRGFQSVDERIVADFLVTYSVILEERIKVDSYSATGSTYRDYYGGYGTIYSSASVRRYQESTLIIDFLDPNNDDLTWRGWGTGIVRTRDRDRALDRLGKGVEAILKAFPPRK